MNLGNGYVALVDDHEEVLGKIVQETVGFGALGSAIEIAGVVLDARAIAEFFDHLHVVGDALLQSVSLGLFASFAEGKGLLYKVVLNMTDGIGHLVFGGNEEVGGEEGCLLKVGEGVGRGGVDGFNALDLVAKEGEAEGVIFVGHKDIYGVSLDTKAASVELHLVADILRILKLAHEGGGRNELTYCNFNNSAKEIVGVAQTIEAGDGGDDDDVPSARHECHGGAETQLVEFLIYGQVFFYIGIGGGNVGLGLIIVVVRDEVLNGIVWEEGFELLIELGRQSLVVAEHKGWLVGLSNDIGNGESLARARDTEQGLMTFATVDAIDELAYGLGLVAHGFIFRDKIEI